MQKIRFLYNNLWDASTTTLTSSGDAPGFPASNTQHRWHTRAWRSTTLTAEWLKVNLTTPSVRALVIKYHNIAIAGTSLRIQADADDASWGGGGPTLNTALTVTADQVVLFWSAAQTFPWWRILATGAAPETYVRIGRVFLGNYFEPTYDIGEAYVKRLIDPSDLRYTTGGQLSAYQKTQYVELAYEFPRVTSSDKATFEAMFAAVGLYKPYFICHDADAGTTVTYYVQNISNWEFGHIRGETDFTLRFDVQALR